jgi:hypothetical protein
MSWRLVLACSIAPAIASADPAADLFSDGRALLQEGKAAEACAKFDAALKLDPQAPGVLLNLGLCNVQQHKVATALAWLRKAQAFPDVASVAQQQVTTLSSLVPTIRIDAPAGMAVSIDGVAVTDRSRIEIDAGHHVAELAGVAQPFDVTDDPSHTQVIKLEPPSGPPPQHHRAPWIVGGVGAGLVVASGVVSLVGKSEFDGTHDLATRQHWKSVVHIGGSALFAAGAVGLGIATVLYLRGRDDTVVAPVAAPDQVGLSLGGVF